MTEIQVDEQQLLAFARRLPIAGSLTSNLNPGYLVTGIMYIQETSELLWPAVDHREPQNHW